MGVEVRTVHGDGVPQLPQRDAVAARRRAASEVGVTVFEAGQPPLLVPFVADPEVPAAVVLPAGGTTAEAGPLPRKGRGRKASA